MYYDFAGEGGGGGGGEYYGWLGHDCMMVQVFGKENENIFYILLSFLQLID